MRCDSLLFYVHVSLWGLFPWLSSLMPTGKVTQVVYGHWDTVTCLSRSECPVGGDCYIVSGARDATLLVWHWSAKVQWVLGDNHVQGTVLTFSAEDLCHLLL